MSLALALTIVGVAIGAVALFFTIRQHRRTARERNARAGFDVTVRTVDADENGIRWTAPNTTTQICGPPATPSPAAI